MSVETIRVALGRLQDEPDNDGAWNDLTEAVTAPSGDVQADDVERLLGQARARHEQRREWESVVRLLELEISFASGTPVEGPMQAELARIYHEELVDVDRSAAAYRRLLQVRPNDATATEALEASEAKREKWRALVTRYLTEAQGPAEEAFRSALFASAADIAYRYGRAEDPEVAGSIVEHVEEALRLDRKNRRAAALAELVYKAAQDWESVARIQKMVLEDATSKEERIAAGLRLGRTTSKKLDDASRAIDAYGQVLDLSPGQPDAFSYLAEAYSAAGLWDHLSALYEDQLRGGGVRPADELGILVQIAMVHWRMRNDAASAEPYFDRVRRAEPAHAGMLTFFREYCGASNDKARLSTILGDAQRALKDGPEKLALAAEIGKLAESQENAQKAIEQYKTVLRTDPENREARESLKRLYAQTEGYNALVELYRQDLERTPQTDVAARVVILREIAAIYRDRVKSDPALVTVLTQLIQLDDQDADAVRELCRVYEALGRWRDLLASQQRLAELSQNPVEKCNLYRAAARRWIDQFSNVQNAIAAYEGLLDVEPADVEAQLKLKELYQKRRSWPQLFALYERQLGQAEEPQAKIELLMEMSKLAAERLDRGADAISLQKRILEIDPTAAGVFDALEKQAEREKDFATVAEVLEKRATAAPDDPSKLAVLQKLGSVYADRLKDAAATTRTWHRVLDLSPGHARALRVLREAYVAAGDWDGLEELYRSQGDWEGLVDFLSSHADRTPDPALKLEISFRAARIFEEELKTPERATRSYERVLTVSPKDSRAAAALVPIYETEEKWARLPALYEILLAATEAEDAQVAMLRKLAAVTGGPLSDKNAALGYARRAYELSADSEGLELLESWSRAAGSWGPFVEAVEGRLKKKKGLSNVLRRQLRLKLAELYARELGKLDEAVSAYRELVELDPTDLDAIRTLDTILRSSGRRDDLRWLFQLRADQVGGDARAEIFEEWATLEEEVFADPGQAIALLRKVIELSPRRGEAMRALARLLIGQGDHADAAQVIEAHRDISEGEDRAKRELELAVLYLDHLNRAPDAFAASTRALAISTHDREAIDLLERMVERPETRALAATVLEAEYSEIGDARRAVKALRVMLESQQDPAQRKVLSVKLADVEERKLHAAGTAFDVILRALQEFPDDLSLWDRASDLALRSGRPIDLAEAYRLHLVGGALEGKVDAAVELELCERAASLHDEKLGDPEGAMPYLQRVLSVDPNNERAFVRLKQILTSAERWGELESLYDRAAQATSDQAARIELLNEVALIAEEIIGDAGKAISYYERILALDPLYVAALDSLEKLYEREERWQDLASLLERRLDTATQEESLDIKLYLGPIYLDRLREPEKSLGHLEEVLRLREGDVEARLLVERLLEIGSLRFRAARVLETVYEGRDEIRNLVRMLDIRREEAKDEEERRDLLRRVSVYRDARLRDDAGAFAALAELLPLEPEEAASRDRFIEIGRRLGEHEKVAAVLTAAADASTSGEVRGQILMEVARICEDLLNDEARAEQVYQRILSIDPENAALVIPAAQALARIYSASSRHDALAEVLSVEVRLEENVDTRRTLYERVGMLYETVLEAPDKAIATWRLRLGDDPSDATALAALERLYEKTGAWRDLVGVLRAREQSTSDSAERRRTMVKAAETLAGKLADVPEAITAWRAVLDDFGLERSTLTALATLYEKAERWVDLAETLESERSSVDETSDQLVLWARLGDVRRLHLEDLSGALAAYRQALVLDPSNDHSRRALEAMLELPDAKREAALTLHPLYEADGDAEHLLKVLEIEVETDDQPGERLATLQTAMRTAEGPLTDPARAFGYALRGVREAAGESGIAQWIEQLERLSELTGRWDETSALYQVIADDILDGDVQQNVRLRVGELARRKLAAAPSPVASGEEGAAAEDAGPDVRQASRELAVTWYQKALDARSDDRRAMIALEELYAEADDAPRLLEILKLRVENAADDGEKKQLLFRMAKLQRGPLEDRDSAISTYEDILLVSLETDAITALEQLYKDAARYADLITLYERQLEGAVGDAAELRVKIAVVAHKNTGDVSRAFDELQAALDVDPTHAGAVAELEALLLAEDPEHRARAGEMLDPVYLRRADWGKVKVALEARLAASQDPTLRRDLLQRLATLHEEQLEDFRAALDTVAALLHEDLSDESVWRELERLAKVAGAEKRLAEIYAGELTALTSDDAPSAKLSRRTGELYADLGDVESALRWYRRAHEFEPESRELFDRIDALLTKEKRYEERVALYRAALDYRQGQARLDALHAIAGLERVELKDPEKAIDTYRAALDVDDNDARSLDALTELYAELERYRDLSDLYERRADAATSGELGAPYRLALARLLRDRLSDTTGAVDQLERIVTEVPWQTEAIKELEALTRDEAHKARVVEILRPLYERADDWKQLVRLNEQRFGMEEDAQEKVRILRETALLWESRGGDKDRAFNATRAAFDIDPEDSETRTDLERLAEALSAWEDLAESYENGIQTTTDDTVKRELYGALARVYDERIDDPRRALTAYGRLSALDPTERDPLDAMDTLALLLADWKTLIAVLERKSETASDDENAAIWRRVAETKFDMLDDAEGAIAAYERALELETDSAATIDALIVLLEPREDAKRLVELYGRRVEISGAGEADLRYTLNVSAAERYERALHNPREAITALGAALDARPGDPAVLSSLERLFRAEQMWDELLDNLMLQASAADGKERRVALRRAIGDLYVGELDNPTEALDQYRLILDEEPADDHATGAVRSIGEAREELRLDAAAILEPVLRANKRHEDLVAVLELRLRAQTEPADRAQTLRAIAVTLDDDLGQPSAAMAALLRALEDMPDDAVLHAEIERLAEKSEGFPRYADALTQRAGAIFDAVVAKDLYLRLGRVSEERLKDDRRSVEAYAKAVEHAGDTPELLEALDRLYGRIGDTKALADVLERRVSVVEGEAAQADLYHRLALIQIESFGDKLQGLQTLRLALERAPDHALAREALEKLTEEEQLFDEAAEVLETVYRARSDNAALARLGEKRVGFAKAPGDRVRLRLDLAKVLEERSSDPRAAQTTLEKALGDDPGDLDVLHEIERLAPVTAGWATAATALETAIQEHSELTSEQARDLWMRVAIWHKDKIVDVAAAERTLEAALKHDPTSEDILRLIEGLQRAPGREKELIGTLRRLAALDRMDASAELRKEAKTLADVTLKDTALTEEILREMLAADGADVWALAELTKIREAAGDFQEVFSLIVRQAELAADAGEIRSLRHDAALVARDKLKNDAGAIDLYAQIFEDEPSDARAQTALRELYAAAGKHKELRGLLERLSDMAESPAARSALRLETAALCLEKLDALADATDQLRAVLEEDPSNERATLLLSQLYEKMGRDEDLAELLTTQIDVAKERGELSSELTYRVRLGEVFETRLNDAAKAIETYQAVLDRDDRHPGALLALARLHEQKGQKADAARMLETILASTPTGADAVKTALRLADLYVALKDDAAVRRVLEQGLKADPAAEEIRKRLRVLYEHGKLWTELADLVTGDADIAVDPAEKGRLYRRAAEIHLKERKDASAAADLLAKATELAPSDRDLMLLLCDAYSASGRGKQAAEVLQRIVESYGGRRSKDLAAIHHRLAKAYTAEGEKDKALIELDVAFKIDPGAVSVLRDLGVLSLDLAAASEEKATKDAHIDRAQKTFRALLLQKLDDSSPISKGEVFYYLADISHRQGDDKKAIQMAERALDNDKELAPAKELMAKLKK